MFNEVINQNLYNSTTYPSVETITDDVVFNGFGLMNDKIKLSFKNDQNLPIIDLSDFSNPVVDGGGVINRRYTEKTINLKGTIKGSSSSELLSLIDEFKLKTSKVEGYLDIKYGDVYRRTKATVVSSDVFPMEHYNINWTNFNLSLKTVDPFFYNIDSETHTETNIEGDRYIEFTYTGTATASIVVYIIFGNTVETDEISLSLGDKKITVSETIASNSIVTIDGINKVVKLGNTEVDYTGRFPTLDNGSNQFFVEINGDMTCDITMIYKNNFL